MIDRVYHRFLIFFHRNNLSDPGRWYYTEFALGLPHHCYQGTDVIKSCPIMIELTGGAEDYLHELMQRHMKRIFS